jgi:hypothetical protein
LLPGSKNFIKGRIMILYCVQNHLPSTSVIMLWTCERFVKLCLSLSHFLRAFIPAELFRIIIWMDKFMED